MVRLVVTALALLVASVNALPQISNGNQQPSREIQQISRLRESTIRDALSAISTGKFKPDDSELISLIKKRIIHYANSVQNPEEVIDVVAKQAQDSVSEVTAAYTTAILQSSSLQDAQRTLTRFQNTINEIVDFARNGVSVV